jgi:hypothetical protein
MLLFSKPSPQRIREFVFSQEKETFSYPDVGASRVQAPSGYAVDHNRVQLGKGADTFERAKRAVNTWKMFDIPWLELCWPDSLIEAGTTVAILVWHLKFWSLNACRIVYVMQERNATETYGFAYGPCANMERWVRSDSRSNSTPRINRCGTTSMRSRGRTFCRTWSTHSQDRCKSDSREIHCKQC